MSRFWNIFFYFQVPFNCLCLLQIRKAASELRIEMLTVDAFVNLRRTTNNDDILACTWAH